MLATLALSRVVAAETRSRKDRPIGFSLYGMQSLPVITAIEQCARIGYECVELSLTKGSPTDFGVFTRPLRQEVRERARATGLELSSLLVNFDLGTANLSNALAAVKAAGEVSRDLDDRCPPLLESVSRGKSEEWEAQKERIAENTRRLAEAAANAGVKLAIKAHYGHAVDTPERLLWLHQKVAHPAFTLTYDYSHYQAGGFGLEDSMRAVVPHAGFIHVKDVVAGKKPAEFLLVGDGSVDYVKYFRLLRELNYTGPLLVEVSAQIHRQPGYDPIRAAEKCHAFLSKARQAAAT